MRIRGRFPQCDRKVCALLPTSEGFTLFVDGFDVAHDRSARWLNESALDSGALEVNWSGAAWAKSEADERAGKGS